MNIFVLRGSREELDETGLSALAEHADLVIDLSEDGPVRDTKGQTHQVKFLDLLAPELALIECFQKIKAAWEEQNLEEAHLGHAACGLFFFYWFSPEMDQIEKLLARRDSKALRAAADDYIKAKFGELRGPTLNLQ